MHRFSYMFVVLLGTLNSSASAQTISSYDFGKRSADVVKLAMELDYLGTKCFQKKGQPFRNLADVTLKEAGGRSVDGVLKNVTNTTKLTQAQIEADRVREVNDLIRDAGGCSSLSTKETYRLGAIEFEKGINYLLEVGALIRSKGERNVFW